MHDFRDPANASEIEELERILDIGPLTAALIYADWCPHCQVYKPHWDKLVEETEGTRAANMVSINDMTLPATTLAHAAIDGFPTVVIVEPGATVMEFPNGREGVTNAFPGMRTTEGGDIMADLRTLVTTGAVPDEGANNAMSGGRRVRKPTQGRTQKASWRSDKIKKSARRDVTKKNGTRKRKATKNSTTKGGIWEYLRRNVIRRARGVSRRR